MMQFDQPLAIAPTEVLICRGNHLAAAGRAGWNVAPVAARVPGGSVIVSLCGDPGGGLLFLCDYTARAVHCCARSGGGPLWTSRFGGERPTSCAWWDDALWVCTADETVSSRLWRVDPRTGAQEELPLRTGWLEDDLRMTVDPLVFADPGGLLIFDPVAALLQRVAADGGRRDRLEISQGSVLGPSELGGVACYAPAGRGSIVHVGEDLGVRRVGDWGSGRGRPTALALLRDGTCLVMDDLENLWRGPSAQGWTGVAVNWVELAVEAALQRAEATLREGGCRD